MTAAPTASPLALLADVDLQIEARSPERRSMDPTRGRATRLVDLAESLLERDDDELLVSAFCAGLAELARAQLEHFPENIFFDLDYPAAAVLRGARKQGSTADLVESFALMTQLQRIYGMHTPIRFRYVHDFSYGFDWAKWTAREAEQDGSVGPFELTFLRYMRTRGQELMALIAADDAKYPTLRDHKPRNPFPFSREPAAEIELHQELARRGLVPVPAWETDATPVWDRAFGRSRVEVAKELGLLA